MAILTGLVLIAAALAQDPPPPAGEAKPVLASKPLKLSCSDTLLATMEQARDEYRKVKPDLQVEVRGGGTGAALAALADGKANVAVATRQANDKEFAAIRSRGFEPMQQVIGYQRYGIVVHASNPIESLTMAQLTELWAEQSKITKWSQLQAPAGVGADTPVCLVGREVNSQAYEMFRAIVMGAQARTRADIVVKDEKELLEAVAKDPAAIGFCRADFVVGSGVRIVPLLRKAGDKPMLPTTVDGYPLQRAIHVYFRDEPDGQAKAFAKWLQSSAAIKTLK